jgi:hypothetical protein
MAFVFFPPNFRIQVRNFTQTRKVLKSFRKGPHKTNRYPLVHIVGRFQLAFLLVWNFAPLQKKLIVLAQVQCLKKKFKIQNLIFF